MMQITKTYSNNHIRTITVTNVTYNEDEETAIMTSIEDGAIAISMADTPDIWDQLQTGAFALTPSE